MRNGGDFSVKNNARLTFSAILLAALVAVIAGAVGAFLGGLVASLIAAVMGMSNMEGARSYFAASIGLLTGLATMLAAAFFTLRWRGLRGAALFAGVLLALLSLCATAAAGFGIWYVAQPKILNANAAPVQLELELMGPENSTRSELLALQAELNTKLNSAPVDWRREENENAGAVISGYVDLYFRTSGRLLVLSLPNEEKLIFNLQLPANPKGGRFKNWSAWQSANFVDRPGATSGPQRASGAPDYKIRYRVSEPGE